jgi:predicted dehydrogenase
MHSSVENEVVRVGIIGLGKMGILHAGVLNALDGSKVVAICEREGLLRRVGKKVLQQISFYDNPSGMVKDEDLDAVYITTPIQSHAPIVHELSGMGKKVSLFIEKPLAGSLSEAGQIVSGSKTLGTVNMIGFQKRFLPQFGRVKKLLDAHALGEILFFHGYSLVSGVFSKGGGWRFEKGQGGSLLDLGPHLIDLLLWYFGQPAKIRAWERSFYSDKVEDLSHLVFDFDSGLIGHADVSWSIGGYRIPETQIEIHGKNGSLVVNDDFLSLRIVEDVPGVINSGATIQRKPDLVQGVDFVLGDPEYCIEDKYFLDCVKHGTSPVPGLDAGLEVNKIIEEAHRQGAN